jgi:cell division GTPase FtsZ
MVLLSAGLGDAAGAGAAPVVRAVQASARATTMTNDAVRRIEYTSYSSL